MPSPPVGPDITDIPTRGLRYLPVMRAMRTKDLKLFMRAGFSVARRIDHAQEWFA
jgi:hypothetical protein